MSDIFIFTLVFSIALAIGIFIGKSLFVAQSKSEKSGLEERINGLLSQIDQLKSRFQEEQNQFAKQIESEKK